MNYNKEDSNVKKFIIVILLLLPLLSFSQQWADDSNIEDVISGKSAYGEDEPLVIVEFWAKFNEANAFADWSKIDIPYVRVDIGKAPQAKEVQGAYGTNNNLI